MFRVCPPPTSSLKQLIRWVALVGNWKESSWGRNRFPMALVKLSLSDKAANCGRWQREAGANSAISPEATRGELIHETLLEWSPIYYGACDGADQIGSDVECIRLQAGGMSDGSGGGGCPGLASARAEDFCSGCVLLRLAAAAAGRNQGNSVDSSVS